MLWGTEVKYSDRSRDVTNTIRNKQAPVRLLREIFHHSPQPISTIRKIKTIMSLFRITVVNRIIIVLSLPGSGTDSSGGIIVGSMVISDDAGLRIALEDVQ